jgi:nicotinamidase-related amidase
MDVLLVMNPQNSFFDPKGSVYMGEKAETLKVRLADYLKGFTKPKIFFREKHALEDTFFTTDKTHSIATTSDSEAHESLRKLATIFYDKTRYNALYETKLESYLKQNNFKNIGIVGVETHTSVLFTAEELRNRGYEVNVVEPCVMSRDDYLHGYAISVMKHYLGVGIING